jgi:PAS domain S-box-containing protein
MGGIDKRRTLRVLIADDEEALRGALEALVAAETDLEVVATAGNAADAIELARKLEPDVALVDVRMPGGGDAATAGIREASPGSRVLGLSAYEDRSSALSLLRAGAIGYLVKGAPPDEIVDAIRRAARGQTSMPASVTAQIAKEVARERDGRRQAADVVQRSETPFRDLFESAPDAVIIIDSAGRIVLVNDQTERLFGYERSELVGRPMELLLPDRFHERHVAHRAGYLADPRTRPMGVGLELAGRRKDGAEFRVDISLSSIESEQGQLVTAFIRDITEHVARAEFERELAARRAVLRYVVSAAEDERHRIANDIHDDSIQAITAASVRLQLLRRALTEPAHQELLDDLAETIHLSISRLRHLLFELRPPALDTEGLSAALLMYLDQAAEQSTTTFRLDDRLSVQPPTRTRLILYRIAQEALMNVRKHANAATAVVTLVQRDGGYEVRVADDGVGFEAAETGETPGHLGLFAMRERTELASGRLRVESTPGHGTTVEAWIPILAEDST